MRDNILLKTKDDPALADARAVVERTVAGELPPPVVKTFFDEPTFTATHVVHDPSTRKAAIIDSVMDFDQPSGKTSFT